MTADIRAATRRVNAAMNELSAALLDLETAQAPNEEPWNAWSRGPLPTGIIDVRLRGGALYRGYTAADFDWRHVIQWRKHVVAEPAWRPWSGGPCPVRADDRVDIKMRCGDIFRDQAPLGLIWSHTLGAGDIVEYRRIAP
ncbi:MAG: hypothetical protein KGJ38_08280 [Burkholderiaceae bacterium]|nr:hypothetical protein [Burkholderiaceae bacterium]